MAAIFKKTIFTLLTVIFLVFGLEFLSWTVLKFRKPFDINWDQVAYSGVHSDTPSLEDRIIEKMKFKNSALFDQKVLKDMLNIKTIYEGLKESEKKDYNYHDPEASIVIWENNRKLKSNIESDYVFKHRVDSSLDVVTKIKSDSFGRIYLPQPRETTKSNILFAGCSYTFGYGVSFNESFAYQLQEIHSDRKIFNLAISGTAINFANQFLDDTEDWYLEGVDKDKENHIFFFHINDHLKRVYLTAEFLNRSEDSIDSFPFYEYRDQDFKFFSKVPSRLLLKLKIRRLLGGTNTFKLFSFDFPFLDRNLAVLIADQAALLKSSFETKLGKVKSFHFVFLPGEGLLSADIKRELKKRSINYIDYSPLDLRKSLGNIVELKYDSHPSQLYHDIVTDLLDRYFKRELVFQ